MNRCHEYNVIEIHDGCRMCLENHDGILERTMTELKIESFTIPAANLGPENPLPVIEKANDLHADIKTDDTFPKEDLENFGWGRPPSILPYRYQDNFDRARNPRAFKAVVLENEHLKAIFIPELGGHLWSLFSKDTGTELLSSNPVFQPCNLALRKAWISGGIEWNLGWTGHWPLTCSSLFAAKRTLPDGTPELRMWEFERVRRMPLQIDAWLPSGSKALFVRVSIHNANDHMEPVYWWTNIAAPQQEGTRVLVSADETLLYNYKTNAMGSSKLPVWNGDEITYPGKMRGSRDFFFRVPASEKNPWEIALQPNGRGLFQTSTSLLRGRKLFRWGIQNGGQTWQKYLCTPDYIEIQGGLARSQSHHLPMPAKATWTWVEAYGEVSLPCEAFGSDWSAARALGASAVRDLVPSETIDGWLESSNAWANEAVNPEEIFHSGSGWGALERIRKAQTNVEFPGLKGIVFPDESLGDDQKRWRALLDGGIIERRDVNDEPGQFGTVEYLTDVKRSFDRPDGYNWLSLFHYGVILWQAGRANDAIGAWMESCKVEENGWARRCIGTAMRLAGEKEKGRDNLVKACTEIPTLRQLVVEALDAFVEDGKYNEAIAFAENVAPELRGASRVLLLKARAQAVLGMLDEAETIVLNTPPPADMREGESAFSELWIEIQARRAGFVEVGKIPTHEQMDEFSKQFVPPAKIDYRMGS